jgi:parallel beta-helix repeat protein
MKLIRALLVFPAIAFPIAVSAQRSAASPAVPVSCGMVISHSVRIVPGTYRLRSAPDDSACVTIRGSNITLDFTGVTLLGPGSDSGSTPDRARGIGVFIDGGRSVTINGATIHGFRFGILARGTHGLAIRGGDLSESWRPRLYSLPQHESLVDWLSFHHNEADEWLRYGAAIYLRDVHRGSIRAVVGERGMNGLMLTASDSLLIEGNNFSFNSGLGIGLYRSSDNRILANRLDYDVRGYSHRFYHRGQDSAGLLLFEQSSRNVVAWNSVTHGGDGLFLWAGQTTMDSGQGGSNDNLFLGNDFSFAATNAMEATFSRNDFVANRAAGSEHGLWGGYSYASRIENNCFGGNRIGIAIEHGQDNRIAGNRFPGDSTAIRLWADSIEPSDWGYPKHRDTRSRDYRVVSNAFSANRVALRAAQSSGVRLTGNRWSGVDSLIVAAPTARIDSSGNEESASSAIACAEQMPIPARDRARLLARAGPPRPVPGSPLSARDRRSILVDEWGPYDWATPRLWPIDTARTAAVRLAVLGKGEPWRVVGSRAVDSISLTVGDSTPGDRWNGLTVHPSNEADWSIVLETVPDTGTSREQPVRFSFSHFQPITGWNTRIAAWTDSTDPRTSPQSFASRLRTDSVRTIRLPRLDMEWYRPVMTGIPQERWGLEATTVVNLRSEQNTLRTISDDGIRVWVDGALVIDHWTAHESAVDEAPVAPGPHELMVQYYQVDGWTELRVEIVRAEAKP